MICIDIDNIENIYITVNDCIYIYCIYIYSNISHIYPTTNGDCPHLFVHPLRLLPLAQAARQIGHVLCLEFRTISALEAGDPKGFCYYDQLFDVIIAIL